MNELFKAFILGAVQGITEFLPISSTGHLILFEHLFGISQETYGLAFDAALHIGTLGAVLWYFREEWIKLFRSFIHLIQVRKIQSITDRTVLLLIIGTLPAVIIGLLLEDTIDSLFRSPVLVALSLILFSFVFWYVEKQVDHDKQISDMSRKDSLVIGLAQSVALIPGVSRSGITMITGMWRKLKREDAATFAFLLSAPIVAGAGGKKLIDTIQLFNEGVLGSAELTFFGVGMISALIFGYLTIKYFLKYVRSHTLVPFVYYRIVVGSFILLAYLFR